MKAIYKKLSVILVTTTAIALPSAKAEIPFTQALGVYQNTKEDKKHLSPFWGFVALHGKMLETIRFFGNYSKNIMEEPDEDGNMVRHEADIPNDAIAALIKRLFNSPDGVQFVATDYEGDPVGNLSRNLPKINDIIKILVENGATNSEGAKADVLKILKDLSNQKISPKKEDQILYNFVKDDILSKKQKTIENEVNTIAIDSLNENEFIIKKNRRTPEK